MIVETVDVRNHALKTIRVGLDLARCVIVLDHERAHILIRMRGVVLIQLALGKQQDTAGPVEIVLIERVRPTRMLSSALVVSERIGLSLLPQDVHLKFGGAFQPAFKVLDEMAFGHIQSGCRWSGGGHDRVSPTILETGLPRGCDREVGLDRHQREHRRGGRRFGVEQLPAALEIVSLPDQIRGYEEIKLESIRGVKAEAASKLIQPEVCTPLPLES